MISFTLQKADMSAPQFDQFLALAINLLLQIDMRLLKHLDLVFRTAGFHLGSRQHLLEPYVKSCGNLRVRQTLQICSQLGSSAFPGLLFATFGGLKRSNAFIGHCQGILKGRDPVALIF